MGVSARNDREPGTVLDGPRPDAGPPAATGRLLSPWRASLIAVENHWEWYRRNWRATVISTFLQPVLFLVALGIGFGSQVQAGPATDGFRYVEFLVPALLVVTAVQTTGWEATYAVFSSFKWERTYWAVVATPVSPAQILYGQLLWIALRVLLSVGVFLLVATLLGGAVGPGVLLALPFALLAGMAFCATVVAWTATRESAEAFSGLFRFVVLPMTLFTGAFFPLSQLPVWVHPLAWLTPVWHGVELARGASFGTLQPLPALGHVSYLVVMLTVGVLLGRRFFHRRLAR